MFEGKKIHVALLVQGMHQNVNDFGNYVRKIYDVVGFLNLPVLGFGVHPLRV